MISWRELAFLLVLFGLGVYLGFNWGTESANSTWQEKWDERQTAYDKAEALAQQKQTQMQQDALQAVEDERKKGDDKLAEQGKRIAVAESQSRELRNQYDQVRDQLRAACTDSGTPRQCATVASAINVLTDVYGRCSTERQGLGRALDESHQRGLNCESAYDRVRSIGLP